MKRKQFLKILGLLTTVIVAGPTLVKALVNHTKPIPIPEIVKVTGVNYSTGTLTIERFNEHLKEVFSYNQSKKVLIVGDNGYNMLKNYTKVIRFKK